MHSGQEQGCGSSEPAKDTKAADVCLAVMQDLLVLASVGMQHQQLCAQS